MLTLIANLSLISPATAVENATPTCTNDVMLDAGRVLSSDFGAFQEAEHEHN
jgi:hypothetical protein